MSISNLTKTECKERRRASGPSKAVAVIPYDRCSTVNETLEDGGISYSNQVNKK